MVKRQVIHAVSGYSQRPFFFLCLGPGTCRFFSKIHQGCFFDSPIENALCSFVHTLRPQGVLPFLGVYVCLTKSGGIAKWSARGLQKGHDERQYPPCSRKNYKKQLFSIAFGQGAPKTHRKRLRARLPEWAPSPLCLRRDPRAQTTGRSIC